MKERKYLPIHPSDQRIRGFRQNEQQILIAQHRTQIQQTFDHSLPGSFLQVGDQLHAKQEIVRLMDLQLSLSGLIASSTDRIHNAIDDGILPISHERVESRLQEMVMIADVSREEDERYDSAAVYYPESDLSRVLTRIQEGEEEDAVVHEMLHVISGREVIEYCSDVDNTSIFRVKRSGLQVYPVDTHPDKGNDTFSEQGNFEWLNEAITEELTMRILQHSTGTYADNRDLFNLLRRQGRQFIPMNTFLQSYFEDYDPYVPHNKRVPHWFALTNEIADSYRPGFLSDLDQIVSNSGVGVAINLMRMYPRNS